MRRPLAHIACALLCALAPLAAGPLAGASAAPAPIGGKILAIGADSMTVQTGGRMVGVVNAFTATADALAARRLYYVWGGGHAAAGIAGFLARTRKHGRRPGFDCSGSVAAVLAGAGLWTPGTGVPNDAGVIGQLLSQHLIAHGSGHAPNEVTLYDDPGVHIFMNINGRFFGTSDGGSGTPNGGPGWLDDGAPDANSRHYKRYHILSSVLRNRTSYGHDYTFLTAGNAPLLEGAEVGDTVTVGYAASRTGTMTALGLTYAGAQIVSGTVTALAPDGSSLILQPATGAPITLATALTPDLVSGLQPGARIAVTFSRDPAGAFVPHALAVVSPPAPPPSPTPIPAS